MKKRLPFVMFALLTLAGVSGCAESSQPTTTSDETSSQVVSSIDENTPPVSGWGFFIDEDGNEYTGQFEDGLYHGYGSMQYINGDYYEGTWAIGLKEGHGKMIFDTACVYVGEFQNDMMHGSGYMSWPMGDYYYGEWREGNPSGHGTKAFLRDPTGASTATSYDIYVGQMHNGHLNGYGVMSYFFGGIFKGTFVDSTRIGQGVYYWEETDNPDIIWLKFEGNFSTRYDGGGWIDGEGTMYYKDGRVVTGTWRGVDLIVQ